MTKNTDSGHDDVANIVEVVVKIKQQLFLPKAVRWQLFALQTKFDL